MRDALEQSHLPFRKLIVAESRRAGNDASHPATLETKRSDGCGSSRVQHCSAGQIPRSGTDDKRLGEARKCRDGLPVKVQVFYLLLHLAVIAITRFCKGLARLEITEPNDRVRRAEHSRRVFHNAIQHRGWALYHHDLSAELQQRVRDLGALLLILVRECLLERHRCMRGEARKK